MSDFEAFCYRSSCPRAKTSPEVPSKKVTVKSSGYSTQSAPEEHRSREGNIQRDSPPFKCL